MNHTQEELEVEAAEAKLHWTYRVLRMFAHLAAGIVFWAWVLILALSGNF